MDSTPGSDQFAKLQPAFNALPAILKAEKSRQGLTNQQLSDLSGVPLATTGRILAGTVSNPGFFHVAAICNALGLSMDECIGLTPQPQEDHSAVLEKTEQQVDLLRERSRMMEREIVSMRRSYTPIVYGLCGLCILLAAVLMTYMVLDYRDPTQGLIRPGSTSLVPILGAAAIVTFSLLLLHTVVSRQIKKSKEESHALH